MKSGIYKLTFAPGIFYIGKSTDVERRWEEHRTNLLRNKASEKMQAAYKQYGMPRAELIVSSHRDHIDIIEQYVISTLNPPLNTSKGKSISHSEWELLMRNECALTMSTVNHIELLEEYKRVIDELVPEVERLTAERTQEEINSDIWHEARGEMLRYKYLYEAEIGKPWWKRLFR